MHIVKTGSRIHISLIDLHGGLGRIDMGVGIATANPGWRITVSEASDCTISWRSPLPDRTLEIKSRIFSLSSKLGLRGSRIVISGGIPAHVGLGSTTQLLMGIGMGLSKMARAEVSAEALALFVGRGGTSGIGVNRLSGKGIMLDAGHRFGEDKTGFGSSDSWQGTRAPKLVCCWPFPARRILFVIPNLASIQGRREQLLFQRLCPITEEEVGRCCRIVLTNILAGAAEGDLGEICRGVERLQTVGFKRLEIDAYGGRVTSLIERFRKLGGSGVGMSSFGPGIFILTGRWSRIREWCHTHPDVVRTLETLKIDNPTHEAS